MLADRERTGRAILRSGQDDDGCRSALGQRREIANSGLKCHDCRVTGIVEALVGHLALRSGAKLKDLVLGSEAELRASVRAALVLAAGDIELPDGTDPGWVADAMIEGRLGNDAVPTELSGSTGTAPLELGAANFAMRLKSYMSPELIDDLERQGIDTSRLFEAFGRRFPEVIRANGTNAASPLRDLASRIEASESDRTTSAIASTLGVNLDQTGETLRELRRESQERTRRRLDALAVPDELVQDVLASIELIPLPSFEGGRLLALEAEGGSGKSTIAERLHVLAIERAETDPSAPLPVFVESNGLRGSLRDAIMRLWGANAELSTRGIDLVVDGLEEIGTTGARGLLLDVRSMFRDDQVPVVRVLVTQRPLFLGVKLDGKVALTLLSDEQATALIRRLSGQEHLSLIYTPVIRDAIHRPFYAIAVGLAVAESPSRFLPSPSTVIESVARRALADVPWDSVADLLGRAAAASVDARHGSVPIRQVTVSHQEEAALASSRLVRVDDRRFSFQIALVAEWFAAEHLRKNVGLVDALIEDPQRLDLWRYPLLLAVESQGFEQMEPALTALARHAPAMAGWILSQPDPFASPQVEAHLLDEDVVRDARKMAAQMRVAFSALGDGLESLSRSWVLFSSGKLLPIAVATGGRRCEYSWHRPDPGIPDVLDALPSPRTEDFRPNWLSLTSVTLTDHPAWVWRHAQDELRGLVEGSIKDGRVFSGAEIFGREARWNVALEALGRRGSLGAAPVERQDLAALLVKRDEILKAAGIEHARDDRSTAAIRALVTEMEACSEEELLSPWDPPDNLARPQGFVWGFWSDTALLNRVRAFTRDGLHLYKHAVDGVLPHFTSHLRVSAAWPARVVGYMSPANYDRGFEGQPMFLWYLDVESDEVETEWKLVEDVGEIARGLYEERQVGRWHMGEPTGIYRADPATAFATSLLWDDLKEWGWTNGRAPQS